MTVSVLAIMILMLIWALLLGLYCRVGEILEKLEKEK